MFTGMGIDPKHQTVFMLRFGIIEPGAQPLAPRYIVDLLGEDNISEIEIYRICRNVKERLERLIEIGNTTYLKYLQQKRVSHPSGI